MTNTPLMTDEQISYQIITLLDRAVGNADGLRRLIELFRYKADSLDEVRMELKENRQKDRLKAIISDIRGVTRQLEEIRDRTVMANVALEFFSHQYAQQVNKMKNGEGL